jgi:hypothetical protein
MAVATQSQHRVSHEWGADPANSIDPVKRIQTMFWQSVFEVEPAFVTLTGRRQDMNASSGNRDGKDTPVGLLNAGSF